jgi:hypothetical protein
MCALLQGLHSDQRVAASIGVQQKSAGASGQDFAHDLF